MPISRNRQFEPTPETALEPTPDGLSRFQGGYWSAPGAVLYLGDVRTRLADLPARSVHAAVTSPPYWGLRKYLSEDHPEGGYEIGGEPLPDCYTYGQAQCGKCFVCAMVGVFRGVHRVLRGDGTLWLNLGDTYCNSGRGLLQGNLAGIPWRVTLALQADGWILRNDIIWHAPNKMPEPVEDRCAKSHEYIFLLTKETNYYYDAIAVEELSMVKGKQELVNKRDVWTVPTQRYPGAHYATYSPRLITPCILAGTSEHGVCGRCSKPWQRMIKRVGGVSVDRDNHDARDRSFGWSRNGKPGSGSTLDGTVARRETIGWRKACGCQTNDTTPAIILDPFVGSGTTVATAIGLGRYGVGIDLSEEYLRRDAIPRIEETIRQTTGARTTAALPTGDPLTPSRLRR